jgi:hypothetical protein
VSLPALRRVRWAVRATLTLGVAASVAANILHARQNPISQAIAAWPPLALLLTVELISRVPMHRRVLAAARLGATAGIAGIAAWVSYWHMAGVAAKYGESTSSAYLLPLSVDGLIIVGSVSLVELAGRVRGVETALAAERQAAAQQQALAEQAAAERQAAAEQLAAAAVPVPPVAVPVEAPVEVAPAKRRPAAAKAAKAAKAPAKTASRRPASKATPTKSATRSAPPRQRRPAAETAALAEAIEATHPEISRSELARQLGISVGRLASVRREMRELERVA